MSLFRQNAIATKKFFKCIAVAESRPANIYIFTLKEGVKNISTISSVDLPSSNIGLDAQPAGRPIHGDVSFHSVLYNECSLAYISSEYQLDYSLASTNRGAMV